MTETIAGLASVRRSNPIASLAIALVAAQGELKNPTKNKQNPHLRNWYADLGAVLESVLPTFTRHGLAVVQLPCELDGEPALTTILLHKSGEWLETVTKIRPVKADPQGVGSAQSYARRYALMALTGCVGDDDDDGEQASRPAKPQPKGQTAPAQRTPPVATGAGGGTDRGQPGAGREDSRPALAAKRPPQATEEQLERLAIILDGWEAGPDDFTRRMNAKYGTSDMRQLSVHQAADLINLLAQAPQATAGKAGAA
jgi:hypothetical protein